MKEFAQEYENVFDDKALCLKKCDPDMVTVEDGDYLSYTAQLKETLKAAEHSLFEHLVRIAWLSRKFTYRGKRRKKLMHNGIVLDRAFGVFMRHQVGYENRIWTAKTTPFSKLVGYMDDLFPGFDAGDPFKSPEGYKFPYKHLTLGHLILVYQMDERMELLKLAEQRKMPYTTFLDYVLNHTLCLNDTLKEPKYDFLFTNMFMPSIRNRDKVKIKLPNLDYVMKK